MSFSTPKSNLISTDIPLTSPLIDKTGILRNIPIVSIENMRAADQRKSETSDELKLTLYNIDDCLKNYEKNYYLDNNIEDINILNTTENHNNETEIILKSMTSQVDNLLSELENETEKQDKCLTYMSTLVINTSEPAVESRSLADELKIANDRIKELENEIVEEKIF